MNPIRLDSAAELEVKRQGFEPDSVPPAGVEVLIQRNGNVSFDITDIVHPSVAAAVELAADVVGLDIAGIDMVNEDASKPLSETRGAIVEVNAGPGLLMHLKPASGSPRPVGKAIIDHLFPATADGRIPLVGVTGNEGLSETARLVAKGLRLQGHDVGLAHTGGLFFNDRQIDARNAAHWEASQRVLLNRAVQAAVIENSPYTIVSEGLAYDRCHVGIVTSLPETALIPERYIEDEDKLFGVVRTQIDVVLKTGCAVLNADDRLVLEMADLSDGDVVLFTQHSPSAAVQEHIASGKRAVVLNAGTLELHSGNNVHTIGLLSETGQSAIVALAVCGALSFLGLTTEQIRQNFA